ncbi:conjugal transfer protein [Rhizobium terrae]|uniref:conjugal transfer protein n=1 Tax=Rhizobium terrae TaxID=2171756 RepID=UPI001D00C9C8|nr:conjugal transfer protein [Rhizobium terrae]
MTTITGVPESELNKVLRLIALDGFTVISIDKKDGGYTVVYGPAPSGSASARTAWMPTRPPVANMDEPTPPPAGQPGEFVHARVIAPKTILYIDGAGREQVRESGSRSWRNCNPGNIRKGDFSVNCGAIGDDGSFAIFPDEAVGMAAIVALLKTASYARLTLKDAIFRYAPPNENDSDQYARQIGIDTGIALTAVLSSLTKPELDKVARTIRKIEGWIEGTVRANAPPAPLLGQASDTLSSAASAANDWMTVASREAALPAVERTQWDDPGENPRILRYFEVCAPWFDPVGGDEVDWCAAFVNYCLVGSGHMGTNHPGARSFYWNKNNQFRKLPRPVFGAIGVRRYAPFGDPAWATGPGHVGFVMRWTDTSVTLLGGNQSRTIKEMTYPLTERDASGAVSSEFVAWMMPVII